MAVLVGMMFISIFTLDYLAIKLGVINRFVALIPELLSIITVLIVVVRAILLRRWEQPIKYVWLVVVLVTIFLIAIVAEAVQPGTIVAGLRSYLKFLPFFFLPAVYRFSDRQIKVLLILVFLLIALQVPLAFFQRFVQFREHMFTGDPITGSVSTSSVLTIILCVAGSAVTTRYVYRHLGLVPALLGFAYILAPTLINETKATIVLLPIATVGPFVLATGIEGRWRKFVPIMGFCVIGLIVFVVVYDQLIQNRFAGTGIGDFFGSEKVEQYLYRGDKPSGGQGPDHVGRFDSIVLPLQTLSRDWMQLLFGLGIGNVSPSFIPGMEGAYFLRYAEYGIGRTQAGDLLWETGILGLLGFVLFYVFAFRDAIKYSRSDEEYGWRGTWWAVCTGIVLFSFLYKAFFRFNEITYLSAFFSGYFASRYYLDRREARQARPRLRFAWNHDEPAMEDSSHAGKSRKLSPAWGATE